MEQAFVMFREINSQVNSEVINRLEQRQLDFWRYHRIFERTTEGREDAPRYVFYEGPPTANGTPGSHHVMSRAFKDMFPRYKVMQGFYCLAARRLGYPRLARRNRSAERTGFGEQRAN